MTKHDHTRNGLHLIHVRDPRNEQYWFSHLSGTPDCLLYGLQTGNGSKKDFLAPLRLSSIENEYSTKNNDRQKHHESFNNEIGRTKKPIPQEYQCKDTAADHEITIIHLYLTLRSSPIGSQHFLVLQKLVQFYNNFQPG